MKSLLVNTLFAIMSSTALAQGAAGGTIGKVKDTIQAWVNAGVLLGLVISSGIIVCAHFFKMRFFQNLADEYQKALFFVAVVTALAGFFRADIADAIASMSNPLGL